jgi:hypothetical protein
MLTVERESLHRVMEAIRGASFRDSVGLLVRIEVSKSEAEILALQTLSMAASVCMKRYEPLNEPEVVHLSGALFNPKP